MSEREPRDEARAIMEDWQTRKVRSAEMGVSRLVLMFFL